MKMKDKFEKEGQLVQYCVYHMSKVTVTVAQISAPPQRGPFPKLSGVFPRAQITGNYCVLRFSRAFKAMSQRIKF